MSDVELQALRDFILNAASRCPKGITYEMLRISVGAAGFEFPEKGQDALLAHLNYLCGKKLLQKMDKAHTASLEVFQLSADGDDYLRTKRIA